MIQTMVSFIRNIDEENSPNKKLREFEKMDMIINNLITLYGYSKDMYLSIMAYAFIKRQPYHLLSSFRYIKMYFTENTHAKKKNELMKKINRNFKKRI